MDDSQRVGSAADPAATVRNVLGAGCVRYVPGDDTAMKEAAAWAARHATELEVTLRVLGDRPGQPGEDLLFRDELRRHRWITADAAPRLTDDGVLALEALNRYIAADHTAETRSFLNASAAIDESSRVLDVGCSTGRLLLSLAPRGPHRMVGVDIDLFALHLAAVGAHAAGRAARWCCASALDLPFPDGAFTHALSFVTLNAVPVRAALAELERVLEDDGQLILTVEGHGYWLRQLRLGSTARRLHLVVRELPCNIALPLFDWQKLAPLQRVSMRVAISRRALTRMLEEAGFALERCEVLRREQGVAWLIGVAARKRRRR